MRIKEFRTNPPRGFAGIETRDVRVVELPDDEVPKGTKAVTEPVHDWRPVTEEDEKN